MGFHSLIPYLYAKILRVGMPKVKRFLCRFVMTAFVVWAFFACRGGAIRAADADQGKADSLSIHVRDTLLLAVRDTVPMADGRLAKRLKEPIEPKIDSLNPISRDSLRRYVKQERKRIRDSVFAELDKRPKHVYFTFDDGPLKGSAAVDSIAREKDIKISAFLVGLHVAMSKDLRADFEKYRENPLVECYNHSYTHAHNRYMDFYRNPAKVCEDFEKNQTDLNLEHKIARLPGRNLWRYGDVHKCDLQNAVPSADMLQECGYKIYGWDVEWHLDPQTGAPLQPVGEVYASIRNYMDSKKSMEANNVVFLMHDNMFQSAKGQQMLASLIDSIQTGTDYRFEFMRSYPYRY